VALLLVSSAASARPLGATPSSEGDVELATSIDDDEPDGSDGRARWTEPRLPEGLAALSPGQISRQLATNPGELGPLSIGWTNSGMLLNAVQLPPDERYAIMDPGASWATQETVESLRRAVGAVHAAYPDSPRLHVGHLSQRRGGRLTGHKSHQSGRDVDVDYYHKTPKPQFYRTATAASLDRHRTWTFVRALITETDVEMIFINTSIQRLLKRHAEGLGEDSDWLDSIFEVDSKEPYPIIRHARGHQTHIHVRFYSPIAQEMGRRAYPALVAMGRIKPTRYFAEHRVRKGDTLGRLAARYGTTVRQIQKANGLRSTVIVQGKTIRIPQRGRVRPAPGPVHVPPRRLPPLPPSAMVGSVPSGIPVAP
jgi:penicillin-insensitive murein endopeptidase